MLALLLSLCAYAEAPPAPRMDVVVTVERDAIPRDDAAAAVTVLDRQQVDQLPATSLASLLAYVPGVTMMFDAAASGGAPMMTSRGFFGGGEVEYVTLLVDGVPAADAESGNADWRALRAATIERVEVLHGPGSSVYGDTALGGVVQFFTNDATQVMLTAGTFGTRELDAGYAANLGTWRLALHASSAETDGFRADSDASDRSLQLSLTREHEATRWRVDGALSRKERRDPGPLSRDELETDRAQSNPLFRADRDRSERKRLAAAYEHFGAMELRAALRASDRDAGTLRTLLLMPGFGTSALRTLRTRAYGATFEAARGALRAGVDLDRASLDGEYESDLAGAAMQGRRDRAGLFVTGAWNVCTRCRLSAGLRRDELHDRFAGTSRDASAWSPRAGLNVRIGNASLFVQASRAFKAPTLDQLFDPRPYPDGFGGTFTISNPGLRPQRARNLEAGVTRSNAASDVSLVAYRMQVTDEIDFDPQTYTYRNIGSSLHRGLELSAAFAKTAWLSPRITYAWTRVADASTPRVQLKNIPEHVAQLLLHARLPKSSSLDVVYRWSSGTTLDDAGLFATRNVSRVDLRAARSFARLRLQLDVLNALDARYSELGFTLFDFASGQLTPLEFPAPGRTLRASAAWRFD